MSLDRTIGLVGLIIVAVVMMAGTFTLLFIGRQVPEPVWIAWGVVLTALFGHGTFLAQALTHQRVIGDLLDAVTVGAGAAAGVTTAGTATNGSGTGKPPPATATGTGPSAVVTSEEH